MPIEYVTSPLLVTPVDALGLALVGPGSAWTNTAWVELIPSTATAITLAGLTVRFGDTNVELEIDVGRGAAGSEIRIATMRFGVKAGNTASPFMTPFSIPISNIGVSQRVALRMRLSSTSTATYRATLHYWATAALTTSTVTTRPLNVYPSAANGVSLSVTTDWAYTAWGELVAATTAAVLIPALIVVPPNSNFDYEVQLGLGPAGSEQPLTTVVGHSRLTNGNIAPGWHQLIPTLDNVPAGSRLSTRLRKSGTFNQATLVAVPYYELPL